MMRFLYLSVAFLLGVLSADSPAFANKQDDAWAQCIWQEAPTSANKWISMTPVKASAHIDKADRYALLAFRLQGFCRGPMRLANKKGIPTFKPDAVRAALIKTTPGNIGADRSASDALRCDIYVGGELRGTTMSFGDPKGMAALAGTNSLKCQRVTEDGNLVDA
jgi:hypothetical protein